MHVQTLESRVLFAVAPNEWVITPQSSHFTTAKTYNFLSGQISIVNVGNLKGMTPEDAVNSGVSGLIYDYSTNSTFKFGGAAGLNSSHFTVTTADNTGKGINNTGFGVGLGSLAQSNSRFLYYGLPAKTFVIAFDEKGLGNYTDAYVAFTVSRRSTNIPFVGLRLIQDGSEEPSAPFTTYGPTPVKYELDRYYGDNSIPITITLGTPSTNVGPGGNPAIEGVDYLPVSRTIVIPAGSDHVQFSVIPIWDQYDIGIKSVSFPSATKITGDVTHSAVKETYGFSALQGGIAYIDSPFYNDIRDKSLLEEGGPHPHVYPDNRGFLTIGIGHNLGAPGKDFNVVQFQALTGANYYDVKAGRTDLNADQMRTLFTFDLAGAITGAKREISNFTDQPEAIKIVLVDLEFNFGSLTAWKDFKNDIVNHNYKQGIFDLTHETSAFNSPPSKYVLQLPNRAARNVALINKIITAQAGH